MRSIKERFDDIKNSQSSNGLSSYSIFAEAIKYQKYNLDTISRYFNKLVDKEECEAKDKKKLLKQLTTLSNKSDPSKKGSRTTGNEG